MGEGESRGLKLPGDIELLSNEPSIATSVHVAGMYVPKASVEEILQNSADGSDTPFKYSLCATG